MPRKQEKVKMITPRDKEFLNMVKVTGTCTPSQANQVCGISEARADMLVKSKLANVEEGRWGKLYSLTNKGLNVSGGGSQYHRAGGKYRSENHDLTLAKEYAKIPKSCRYSARPGTSSHGGGSSNGSPDLIYTTEDGVDIGIEVYTDNYSNEQIQEKINYANNNQIQLVLVQAERSF